MPRGTSGTVELLGIEPLEEHARRLAALFTVTSQPRRRGRAHLQRLKAHRKALDAVYVALAEDARRGTAPSPAAEWLLDNFHIVSAAARDIVRDLPASFFRRLPTIAADEFAGLPRIYALALELIRTSAGHLDASRLQRFISAYQSVTPLTIGELWAWPSALKLALVEAVSARGEVLASTLSQRQLADRTVEQLVTEILKHWPGRWLDFADPNARHEAGQLNLTIDKAYHTLGWQPRWSFEEAVRYTVSWYRQRQQLRRPDPVFLRELTQQQILAYSDGWDYARDAQADAVTVAL